MRWATASTKDGRCLSVERLVSTPDQMAFLIRGPDGKTHEITLYQAEIVLLSPKMCASAMVGKGTLVIDGILTRYDLFVWEAETVPMTLADLD